MSDSTNSTRKMKNKILAIDAAPAAIPLNPKIAAMIATTRKIIVHLSIVDFFWVKRRCLANTTPNLYFVNTLLYNTPMNDTIFGKIIRREIPATIVYEDADFLAFMDIRPVSKGHLLIIPKAQYTWIQDVPDELLSQSILLAKKLIHSIKKGIGCDFVQLTVVGNEVPHFHIHLIPRYVDDTVAHYSHIEYESPNEMTEYAEKIKTAL